MRMQLPLIPFAHSLGHALAHRRVQLIDFAVLELLHFESMLSPMLITTFLKGLLVHGARADRVSH